ncbi:MAG: hypothetical protein MZU97_11475 [Bacillus subtilis]|nr:hypothetical protein [Bacillus subtilis]
MAKALYVHIPFCDAICTYCDFPKMVAPASFKTAYVDALKTEIAASRDELSDVDTIYLGGGTPSSLSPSCVVRPARLHRRAGGPCAHPRMDDRSQSKRRHDRLRFA